MCNILKETYSFQPKDIFLYKYKSNEIEMCPRAGIYFTTKKTEGLGILSKNSPGYPIILIIGGNLGKS